MTLLKRIGRHMRGNVVAYLALFVALGGTSAYAANTIGSGDVIDDSLQSVDLKNGDVQAVDIAPGAVDSAKIKDGSVAPADLGQAPAVEVLETSAQPTANATGVSLNADHELLDPVRMHSTQSNPQNLVARVAGRYFVSATVDWDPSGAGYRRASLVGPNLDTFASVAGPALPAPAFTSQNVSGVARFQVGETVHVEVNQGSAAELGARLNHFEMSYLGR